MRDDAAVIAEPLAAEGERAAAVLEGRGREVLKREGADFTAAVARASHSRDSAKFHWYLAIFLKTCSNRLLTREFPESRCLRAACALLTPFLCSAYAGRPVPDFLRKGHIYTHTSIHIY